MHFSIPDTEAVKRPTGEAYTVYHMYVNGAFHCAVRYRQFDTFYEKLKKDIDSKLLPSFPNKKLFSLSALQLDERRIQLERFIQLCSQNSLVTRNPAFNEFLLTSQQLSEMGQEEKISLTVLMSGKKGVVTVNAIDATPTVLQTVTVNMNLPTELTFYFALFLTKIENGSTTIIRKLQDFEAPYLSLKTACQHGEFQLVLRKSYWDSSLDEDLLDDRVALNLLYDQAIADITTGWTLTTKEQLQQLQNLSQRNSKKEYLSYARQTLRYYGFLPFKTCECNYPVPNTQVLIAAGNKELSFHLNLQSGEHKETSFKVTRMRCWRIVSSALCGLSSPAAGRNSRTPQYDLAFEYLVAQNKLRWITISSDQAILMSMCLQSMVEELLMKKQGLKLCKNTTSSKARFLPITSSALPMPVSPTTETNSSFSSPSNERTRTLLKQLSNRSSTSINSFKSDASAANDSSDLAMADDGIGDDDL